MNLETKIDDIYKQFSEFTKNQDTDFTDLHLLTDKTEEGFMEVRVAHSLDPSQISL